jgi:two-component system cell cycle sensor histidine kinase/response regulator CckA
MLTRLLGDDVVITVELDAALPEVVADTTQICQVLMNLAINARDAMPDGGKLTIVTRAQTQEGQRVAELEVRDTGTGIPASALPMVFDPFFTTKEPGKGTGIGLATVHGIVKQSAGKIAVSSEVGAGTAFVISLPAAPATAPAPSAESLLPAHLNGRGEQILLVDDTPAVRVALARMLERHGFRAVLAADGLDALEVYEKNKATIRLVITDVEMPGLDGPGLARALRRRGAALPILFISGARTTGLAPEAEFLPKPFSSRDLMQRIQSLLSQAS